MAELLPDQHETIPFDEQAFSSLVGMTKDVLASERPEHWPLYMGIERAFKALTTNESVKTWEDSLATEHVDTTLGLLERLVVFSGEGKQQRFGYRTAQEIASSSRFFVAFTLGNELVAAANTHKDTDRGDRINELLYASFTSSPIINHKVAVHMTGLLPRRLDAIRQAQDETAGKQWAERARTALHGLDIGTRLQFGGYLLRTINETSTEAFMQEIMDHVLCDFQAAQAILPHLGLSAIEMSNAWNEGYGQYELDGKLYGMTTEVFRLQCLRRILALEAKHEGAARWLRAKRGWRANFGRFSVEAAESQYLDGIQIAQKNYQSKKRTVIPMPTGDHNGANAQIAEHIETLLALHKLQGIILEIGYNREALARISQGTREGWLPAEVSIFTPHGTAKSFLWSGQRLNGNGKFEQVLVSDLEALPARIGTLLCTQYGYSIFLGCGNAETEGGFASTFAKVTKSRTCGSIGKMAVRRLLLNLKVQPLTAHAYFSQPRTKDIYAARHYNPDGTINNKSPW